MVNPSMKRGVLTSLLILALLGCESDPPTGDGGLPDATLELDAGPIDPPACEGLAADPPSAACEPLATDYTPGADDDWAACISDDGEYHRVLEDISTIARVAAFETMREQLFDPTRDPSPDDFLAARQLYQEPEGLDSRVVRRYDPHFEVPEGTDCSVDGVPEEYPDYCVGPAILQPILLDAFERGVLGTSAPSRVEAARIEAALLWFLFVSPYKESLTCTRTAKDCDSAYAYYTGGEDARGGVGLAADVARVSPEAHDRAWDGLLAVRCWRDLDAEEVATDLALRDRAREQYDRALLDGVAALVRERLVLACDTSDAELLYHWTFARTLGMALDREARARDATAATALAEELAHERPADADVARAVDALDTLFDCR